MGYGKIVIIVLPSVMNVLGVKAAPKMPRTSLIEMLEDAPLNILATNILDPF